jgi:hypothetical protein
MKRAILLAFGLIIALSPVTMSQQPAAATANGSALTRST